MAKKLWILTLLGAASTAAIVIHLLVKRVPQAPPLLAVTACGGNVPGTHRIKSDFGAQFDVAEKDFSIHAASRDMPPGILYEVKLLNRDAVLVLWHDDDIFNEWKTAFPVFSEHVEERQIRTSEGHTVGKDRWGYLKTGERWRYVTFSGGDAAAYRPIRPDEASILDRVINSACQSPAPVSSK